MAGRYRLINQTSMHRRRSGWNSGGRKASAEGGVWGRVSIPSPADYRSRTASWAPPARSGSESRPETHVSVFWRPQKAPFVPICWCFEQSGAWNFETWQNLGDLH